MPNNGSSTIGIATKLSDIRLLAKPGMMAFAKIQKTTVAGTANAAYVLACAFASFDVFLGVL
jgi:hypothetical protein